MVTESEKHYSERQKVLRRRIAALEAQLQAATIGISNFRNDYSRLRKALKAIENGTYEDHHRRIAKAAPWPIRRTGKGSDDLR